MRCPKCGHQQANTVECEGCGIFFDKYQQYLKKTASAATPSHRSSRPTSGIAGQRRGLGKRMLTLSLLGLLGLIAAAAYLHYPPALWSRLGGGDTAFEQSRLDSLKRAVVFIRTDEASGSGFLIRRGGGSGLVVTNQHVVDGVGNGKKVGVFFNSGQADQRRLSGRLLPSVPGLDLALIELDADRLPQPIDLAPRSPVRETEKLFVLGFPFGGQLATNRDTPRITISGGAVTSLRADSNDQILYIQTDASINAGNSGGPVVDSDGYLVGITVAKLENTDIGFVIPRRRLRQMLDGQMHSIAVEVEKHWGRGESGGYAISATAGIRTIGERHTSSGLIFMRADAAEVAAAIRPDQAWDEVAGQALATLKMGKGGKVRGKTRLSWREEGRRLCVQPYLQFGERRQYQAPLWLELELEGGSELAFDGPNRAPTLEERVTAAERQTERKRAERSAKARSRSRSADTGRGPDQRPAAAEAVGGKVTELPGRIESVALAGAGRYLAFGVYGDSSVVLYDLKEHKLLPLDIHLDETTLVSGDRDHVYIAGTDSGSLFKWSLSDQRVVYKGFAPSGAPIKAMASAWNRDDGALFLITDEDYYLVDKHRFQSLPLRWTSDRWKRAEKPNYSVGADYRARASGDGTLFTFWHLRVSPNGVNSLRLSGNEVHHHNIHSSAGVLIPNRDGSRVYTSTKGAYSNKLDQIDLGVLGKEELIPDISGGYLLRVTSRKGVRAALVETPGLQVIGTIDIPELDPDLHRRSLRGNAINGGQRLWLDPEHHQLIVIPHSDDRLVVYPLPAGI